MTLQVIWGQRSWCQMKDHMHVPIYMSNCMSNRNHFKDIGTFLSKKLLMSNHVIRNALDDPKIVKCSAHNLIEFFGPNQKSLSLKMATVKYGYCIVAERVINNSKKSSQVYFHDIDILQEVTQ